MTAPKPPLAATCSHLIPLMDACFACGRIPFAPQPLSGAAQPRPSYYAQGGMTTYIEGQDPEVTCGHCGKTFLCDMMDATCRLCGKFFRDAPAAPVAVPAGQRRDLCRHCQYDFTNQATQCGRCPCCGDMLWDAPPAPLPPPQEPTDQAMLDTAMLMVDRLVSKFPQMEAAVIRPALKLEALQMMCTFGKEIRAAVASRIAQLQETNRELNRRNQALQHSLNLESGRKSWYRFFKAAMTCFKDEANRAETAETALTQAQQERDSWRRTSEKLETEKVALLEAIEPFAQDDCERPTTKDWHNATRVYEQVKEKI